jgi:hypothetical protein
LGIIAHSGRVTAGAVSFGASTSPVATRCAVSARTGAGSGAEGTVTGSFVTGVVAGIFAGTTGCSFFTGTRLDVSACASATEAAPNETMMARPSG